MEAQPSRFSQSLTLTGQLIQAQLTPLLVLFAVGALFTLTSEDLLLELTRTADDQRWAVQIGMGLWDLVEGLVLIIVLSWGIPKVRALTEAHFEKHPFQESYLNSFFAEYLRLLASVLLWGLLLIVPGFVRYARLIFVPFITLFAKPYRDGKIDALKLSLALSQGRLKVIIPLILGTTAIQTGVEFAPHLVPDLHVLPARVAFIAVSFLISIWLYSFVYLLFEQAMEEYKWT